MSALILVVAPFVSNWVTSLIKHSTPLSGSSAAMIRLVLAIIAIAAAILESYLFGGALPDNFGELLNTVAFALVNFLGATGVFHLGTAKT